MLKNLLEYPQVYQGFQEAGGFFQARLKSIADYLPIEKGSVVIDIGCGPGYIAKYLKDVTYIGYDTDQSYIDFANKNFSKHGVFKCRIFDENEVSNLPKADVVMLNGVIHHLSDEITHALLKNIAEVLKDNGRLFNLDGYYFKGQSWLRKWMLDNDRGQHVRTIDGYKQLLEPYFKKVVLNPREDISWFPYSFMAGISTK
jgi:SAM-dependent methyltransferase